MNRPLEVCVSGHLSSGTHDICPHPHPSPNTEQTQAPYVSLFHQSSYRHRYKKQKKGVVCHDCFFFVCRFLLLASIRRFCLILSNHPTIFGVNSPHGPRRRSLIAPPTPSGPILIDEDSPFPSPFFSPLLFSVLTVIPCRMISFRF